MGTTNLDQWMSHLEQGGSIVTSTRRLCRHLEEAFAAHQLSQARQSWPSPDVVYWTDWVMQQFEWARQRTPANKLSKAVVLSQSQEQVLWEDAIAEFLDQAGYKGTELLWQVTATARAAKASWLVLRDWGLSVDSLTGPVSEDTSAFRQWTASFSRRCAKQNWIDRAGLPHVVAGLFKEGVLFPQDRSWSVGFDELSPIQKQLFELAGVQQFEPSILQPAGSDVKRVSLTDELTEFDCAARWARSLLEHGEAGPIGIVVPDLARVRDTVDRVFSEHLLGQRLYTQEEIHARPFHLSLGGALAQEPIVSAALGLLQLTSGISTMEHLGVLLRSPFLAGGVSEFLERTGFEATLRRRGDDRLSLHGLVKAIEKHRGVHGSDALKVFQRRLLKANALAEKMSGKASPTEWARRFSQYLAAWGWPGERQVNSKEFQAAQAWDKLLSSFAATGLIGARLSFANALARLRAMAVQGVFQSRAEPAPVQILGLLESAGMEFTHLWIAGLTDERWPAAPRPDPFIPVTVQRRFEMPHADAAQELKFAQAVTERLLNSAPHIVVSTPRIEGERPLYPSPLLSDLPEIAVEDLPGVGIPNYPQTIHAAGPGLEEITDNKASVIDTDSPAPGGAALFKDQSACPFRAFARHRLRASSLEHPEPGLDKRERGIVMHRVMEALWREIKTQARLIAMDEAQRRECITRVVERVLQTHSRGRGQTYTPRFIELERQRLIAVALAWLEIETGRAAFEVLAPEKESITTIEGVAVRLRPDRVDRLETGELLVIDYKTGKVDTKQWFGDRPDDPQLPLYAQAMGDKLGGISFAGLRVGNLGFQGIAHSDGLAPGIKLQADWEGTQEAWRAVLQKLARDYAAGDARVDPKDPAKTCRYCDIRPLCRITDQDAAAEEIEPTGRSND